YLVKPVIVDKLIATLREYEVFRGQLRKESVVNQEKIDVYFRKSRQSAAAPESPKMTYPKGIDKHTLKLVRAATQEMLGSQSADELSRMVGISYSTMRRYLEYLVSLEEIEVEIIYGSVGRPERKYKRAAK
ncbi:MAG: response regulator, partial [Bhargavaea sp.]